MQQQLRLAKLAVILISLACGCAEPAATGGSHETPEAVFAAAQDAGTKNDYAGVIGTLTDEAVQQMAVGSAIVGGKLKELGQRDDADADSKKSAEAVAEVFQKHGIPEELFAAGEEEAAADPADVKDKLLATIKDPADFSADMLAAMSHSGTAMPIAADAELAQVKVTGEEATGNMVTKAEDGTETKTPIEFRKVDGQWKIHR